MRLETRGLAQAFRSLGPPAAISLGLHLSIILLALHIIPASGKNAAEHSTPPNPAQIVWAQMISPAAPTTSAQIPPQAPPLTQPSSKQKTPILAHSAPSKQAVQSASPAAPSKQQDATTTATITTSTTSAAAAINPAENDNAIGKASPAPNTFNTPSGSPGQKARPNYAHSPAPDYPSLLQDEGIGGVVWLKAWVEIDGQASRVTLLRGSGYRILDESALRAVQAWRFFPAKQDGLAFASWVEFPIRFQAQQDG
jgi:protein TonB